MVLRVERIFRFGNRDEFHRRDHRSLVEKLEYGVLGIGSNSAPSDGRGRLVARLSGDGHGLAVGFQLKLLQVEGQETKPLVVCENSARLAAHRLDVKAVSKGREQRQILARLGEAEM